jgi:hypothetical protein
MRIDSNKIEHVEFHNHKFSNNKHHLISLIRQKNKQGEDAKSRKQVLKFQPT